MVTNQEKATIKNQLKRINRNIKSLKGLTRNKETREKDGALATELRKERLETLKEEKRRLEKMLRE